MKSVVRWAVMGAAFGGGLVSPALAEDVGLLPEKMMVDTLENGLKLVVIPVDAPGLATIAMWMKVGSGEESQAGLTGFAHFFEHLMFHGSEKLPGDVREQQLLALSVAENAWTSTDATVYHLTLPARNIDAVLAIEADRFQFLHLEEEGVRKEAGAVYGEFRKGRASAENALWTGVFATAFDVHPYHHTTIGIEADIQAMPDQTAAARTFFQTWYRPDNAILIVAGDVQPAAVRASIHRHFGDWKAASGVPPWPAIPVEPAPSGERRSQIVWESGPVNPHLAMAWRVPAVQPGTRESAALSLLPALLTSDVAPLQRKLVEEDRAALWVWSEAPDMRQPGLYMVMMELVEGQSPANGEAAVRAALQALVDDTSPEAQARFEMSRDRRRREVLLGLDSPEAWASAVGRTMLVTGEPRTLDKEIAALATVTHEDVAAAVRTYLLPTVGQTVVTLVPAEAAQPGIASPPVGPERRGGEQ